MSVSVVDVKRYRDVAGVEMEEVDRLARTVHPPGKPRPGSELRCAALDAETDFLIRLRDEEALRACAWVTTQLVSICGEELRVAGIRGVMTDPDRRRRGYGRAVMERAQALMRSQTDCEIALLFSSVMAVPFYESLGWQAIPGPVTCEQPEGRIDYTETLPTAPVMAFALRTSAELPAGSVRLRGLPW